MQPVWLKMVALAAENADPGFIGKLRLAFHPRYTWGVPDASVADFVGYMYRQSSM